jgi:hypothetical protein
MVFIVKTIVHNFIKAIYTTVALKRDKFKRHNIKLFMRNLKYIDSNEDLI